MMDARNNLANQEVFRMARAADPKGTRTVGIITKCDALQQGDENMVSHRRHSKLAIPSYEVAVAVVGVVLIKVADRYDCVINLRCDIAYRHTSLSSSLRQA